MSYTSYEDLDVYKQARALVIVLHKLTLEWGKHEQFGGLADQIRRSSRSVMGNLAEGLSKNMSVADKTRSIQIAMGSAEETRVWLDLAHEFGYMTQENSNQFREDYKIVTRMLYKLQQSMK